MMRIVLTNHLHNLLDSIGPMDCTCARCPFLLLIYISPSIESYHIAFLSDAGRFLWQDYNSKIWLWDIVDSTMRQIFLTGIIMFIDIQEGANKILRLVVANIVSVLYIYSIHIYPLGFPSIPDEEWLLVGIYQQLSIDLLLYFRHDIETMYWRKWYQWKFAETLLEKILIHFGHQHCFFA